MTARFFRQLTILLAALTVMAAPGWAVEFRVDSLAQSQSLAGVWRFHVGDDMAWARPDYNDGRWDNILLPRSWRKQGYEDFTGIAWYRATIKFDLQAKGLPADIGQLGITLGKIHSAYELYAGGKLLGGGGKLPPEPTPVFDSYRSFSIPRDAIDENGELTLAIRVWRHPSIGWFSSGGAYEGPFEIGKLVDLTRQVGFSQIPALILAFLYGMFGLYHLYLYRRNPQLREYLWFGLLTIGIGVYGLSVSQWKHYLDLPFMPLKTLEHITVFLLPALGMQMVWSLLQLKPPPWARAYQVGFLVFAALAGVVPGYDILVRTLPLWQLYTLPCLLGILVQVAWFAVDGNREARTVLVGVAVFIGTSFNDILVDQSVIENVRLVPLGFAAIIISMAISLANRFTAIFSHLEDAVESRTRELSEANARLVELARTDPLTRLLNRRGFADEVEKEISRAGRSQRPFVLIMADVDDFKWFNDQYGHACGDFVLGQVAWLLREQSRDVDIIARWGGEEFALLLPETGLEGGTTLAEKLRAGLDEHRFQYGEESLHLTITLGVAQYREGMMLDDCLALADEALYHGKDSGRNRVQLCPMDVTVAGS